MGDKDMTQFGETQPTFTELHNRASESSDAPHRLVTMRYDEEWEVRFHNPGYVP